MTSTLLTMRALVRHAVGGGWGNDHASQTTEQVAVIRGADFPGVAVGDTSQVPVRWEEARKIPQRVIEPGDIILEISGGTSDRPTGRTIFATQSLLDRLGRPAIPASFCRLVRIDRSLADPEYVYWWLQGMYLDGRTWSYQNRSTGIANFQFEHFLDAESVRLPSRDEQTAIAATLSVLDEKLESNRRLRELMRSLGSALLSAAIADAPSRTLALGELTTSIARGVAPKYADDDPSAPLVLNQKCVREGWATTSRARRMVDRGVSPHRMVNGGDVLVNSTGTGTLGRVGRWHGRAIFADGHLSVVKIDTAVADPTVLAYALFPRESDIEGLATGSTGQTELSPSRLASLTVELPDPKLSADLEPSLLAIEDRINGLQEEDALLRRLRDTLLPDLLSGRIRVPELSAVRT